MADGSVKIDITADDSDVKKKLDGVDDAAQDAADGLDDLGDSAEDAGKGLDTVDVAAGNLIANGLSALVGALTDAVGNLLALSDETREFREDMAKLETAFSDAGHSTETASGIYEDFYAILGESDRSVEAVNHLAELTKSEEEVAKWATIAAGVTAKFGDSLPIEGLTEAANETAKVGEVTGPLADALNWAGISEEEFNAKLAECADEQERAALITETLNKEYAAAAAEYNELTASTQDARRATAEMEQTQADLGAAIEPVTTAWLNLKNNALQAVVPVVENVVAGLQDLAAWMEENPKKAEIVKGVLLGVATALGVLATALGIVTLINTVKSAFAALNLTMLANPVVLIVAAIAGLVAAFIYLWNNCEGFRDFWVNLWEKVKSIVSAGVEAVKEFFSGVIAFAKENWQGLLLLLVSPVAGAFKLLWDNCEGFREFWITLWENIVEWVRGAVDKIVSFFTVTIPAAIEAVKQWFVNLGLAFVEFATVTVPEFINSVVEWFQQLPERIAYLIGYVIGSIAKFGLSLWEFVTVTVPEFIEGVIEWFSQLPGRVWAWLTQTIQRVTEWGTQTVTICKEKMQAFFNAAVLWVSQLPGKIWEWLKQTYNKVAEFFASAVKTCREKMQAFVNTAVEWVSSLPGKIWDWFTRTLEKVTAFGADAAAKGKEAATGLTNAVIDGVTELPGKIMSIGSDIVSGLWKGISSGWKWLTDKVKSLADSLLDGVKDALGIHSPSKEFAWVGEMSADGYGVGYEDEMNAVEKDMKSRLSSMVTRVKATVSAENARMGQSVGTPDTGLYDLARAVGTQTAGINSLASEYRRGATNTRPIILQLDKRELGRAVVDVGGTEAARVGLSMGGA